MASWGCACGGLLNGAIDEVRLYNSVLTSQQVPTLKNSYSLFGTMTVGYWQFNDFTNLGTDSSGLSNTITTACGTPTYSSASKFGGALYLNGNSTMSILSGAFPIPEAVARRGPMDESQSAFTVHDGAELTVLARDGDWLQVSGASRQMGWLPQTDVALTPGRKP